ncbi:MAG: DUF2259 domain-containing protein [Pseudomonadota bacterium]
MYRRGMLRQLALAFSLSFAALTAHAADLAELTVRGFSPDGTTITFEERGVQDGSGFAYANVFVVDVERDAYVEGSPIRVRLEEDGASPWKAISTARQQAKDAGLLRNDYVAGNLVAAYPFAQYVQDKTHATFVLDPQAVGFAPLYLLRINSFPAAAGLQICSDMGFATAGFEVDWGRTDEPGRVSYRDKNTLPKSRGCATDYEIAEVRTYFPPNRGLVTAAILRVRTPGFENAGQWRHIVVFPR